MYAARSQFAAPGILGVAACLGGELPLRFGRKLLADPIGVGLRIAECHMHDGVVFQPIEIAAGTQRMTPVSTENVGPPAQTVAQVDVNGWGRKDERPRAEHGWICPRILVLIRRYFRTGNISRRLHELRELSICHRRFIHEVPIDPDVMCG